MTDENDPHAQRWLDAQSALRQQPTSAARRRLRRSRTVRLLVIIAVPVIAIVVAFLWNRSGHRLGRAGTFSPGPLLHVIGWALAGLGAVLWLVGLIWMIRTRQFRPAWKSPLVNLTHKDRKLLIMAIRRDRAAPPGRDQLATYLATRMSRQYPFLLFLSGVLTLDSGQALVQDDAFLVWSIPVLLAIFALAAAATVRDVRRASRWLANHGSQDHPPPDSADGRER